jgi:hypothetical protein
MGRRAVPRTRKEQFHLVSQADVGRRGHRPARDPMAFARGYHRYRAPWHREQTLAVVRALKTLIADPSSGHRNPIQYA